MTLAQFTLVLCFFAISSFLKAKATLTFANRCFSCNSSVLMVAGKLFRGMSVTVVMPPVAAAAVPVLMPVCVCVFCVCLIGL